MKILVVDDSKVIRHTMLTLLRQLGYHDILACEDVKQARAALAQDNYDLILSDWHMPGESGLDFLKYVRATERYAKIPFIMITTETERANVIEALKAGVQNYIFKPIQKDVLMEKIGALVKSHGIEPPSENKKTITAGTADQSNSTPAA
jgi:two-component system chemotaxis response regulator CheY